MTACPHQNRGGPGVPSTCHREEFAGKFFPCWFYLFYHGKKCTVSGVGQSLGASLADGDMEGLWVGLELCRNLLPQGFGKVVSFFKH